MDFSRFERDVFGNVFTIKRGYSDKITYPYVIQAADLVQVRQILVARRATLTAYVGHPDVPLTITYGYFIDLDIPIDNWGQSNASVVVESVLYDTPGTTESFRTSSSLSSLTAPPASKVISGGRLTSV
jgi:hypothetical protein